MANLQRKIQRRKQARPVQRTSRPPTARVYLDDAEAIVDSFAGGGGASSGIEWATGRSPDIAINHSAEAIAMHRANHPTTRHYIEDIWLVDPIKAMRGRPVGLAWFSPDCTHFSSAKGDVPKENKVRGLAWVAARWAAKVRPRVIILENVREFRTWGPLHGLHTVDGCTTDDEGKCSREDCRKGKPIKAREGQTYRGFIERMRRHGYTHEERLLKACDYGAPTYRERLFLVFRCDGNPIEWPEATHGPGRAQPYRTAAECIDWSIPCPSIFDRPERGEEPLVESTLRRIARGLDRFVLNSGGRPFIVPVNHGGVGRDDRRVHDSAEPLRTITSHGRGAHAIAVPTLIRYNGERRPGEDRRVEMDEPLPTVTTANRFAVMAPHLVKLRGTSDSHINASAKSVEAPLDTVSAKGEHHMLAVPYLIAKSWGERKTQAPRCMPIDEPIGTVVAGGIKHALAVAWLMRNYGGNYKGAGADVREPMPTVTSRDHHSLMSAFLVRYNGESEAQGLGQPLGTLTTRDRYSLVTVEIDGEEWIVVDIGMRMLTPRELFLAQGFARGYKIDPAPTMLGGKPLTRTAQVRCAGNSVPPPVVEAIVRANKMISAPTRELRRAA